MSQKILYKNIRKADLLVGDDLKNMMHTGLAVCAFMLNVSKTFKIFKAVFKLKYYAFVVVKVNIGTGIVFFGQISQVCSY